MGMKQILLMIAVVVLVGCGTTKVDSPQPTDNEVDPNAPANISDPIVEKAVRQKLKKPTGELTSADLEKATNLVLGYTKITDAGLKEVTKLKNLTHLNLESTKITDAGLKEVAKLQNLTELYLHNTKITDAGLKEVAKLQNLTMLALNDTKITDACIKDLAKLHNLTILILGESKITEEGAAELRKALPKCENFYYSYKKD